MPYHPISLPDLRGDERLHRRFWAKVTPGGPTPERRPDLGACWVWIGYRTPAGYGKVGFGGHAHFAHRIAWVMTHGPILGATYVLHHCDNPPCVRPEHLFLGSHGDNMQDMWQKRRHPVVALKGEASNLTKLTEADVRRIRDLAATGLSQARIAAQFGVNQANVSQIVRRVTWRHV